MSWNKNSDCYHISVAGINPHEVAEVMEDENTPFTGGNASVAQHIMVDGEIVGGIVEVWAGEHLSGGQEGFLADMGRAVDVRHVWP